MDCQRGLFGLPADLHYLNCAYMAPVSDRVAEAARRAVDRLRVPSRLAARDFFEPSDTVRRLFARLVNASDPARVAIIPSVSYGMATVVANTPLGRGDNVVLLEEQFPSAVYAWRRAGERTGATVRTILRPAGPDGRGGRWTQAVIEAIDRDTAAVVLPQLHWTDGTRFDLDGIGQRTRDCGARLIVDGTQSVGALPFDVQEIRPDALLCAGYKWLTGPYSIGLAYFGPAYDDGVPIEENWIAREGSEDFAGLVRPSPRYQPGAIRYDVGERSNFVLLPMLEAGLTQVLEWSPSAIQEYCAGLVSPACRELARIGCQIESSDHRAAHLFGIRLRQPMEVETMTRVLSDHGVSASIRGTVIRVAPHVYNDAADLDALVDVVRVLSAPATAG